MHKPRGEWRPTCSFASSWIQGTLKVDDELVSTAVGADGNGDYRGTLGTARPEDIWSDRLQLSAVN